MPSQTSARTPTVCVTNAKGGTGKTTIAINVAGALNERGHDVLFVDIDPQGNATEGLGLLDAYDAEPPTLFDVLTDHAVRTSVEELIVEHEEMDVLPSSIDLLQAEHELTIADLLAWAKTDDSVAVDPAALSQMAINITPEAITGGHALDALDETLAQVETEYDYVIIDSPPFYGKLTDTAIYAAQNVLVPALTEATSERAIELLIDQIAALEGQVDITVDTVGVVANRVEQTNEDATMLSWLNEVFEDYPLWEVRKRVALQRAFSAGTSIFAYEQQVDMEDVFLDIAKQFETHFEREPQEVTA
ncbi:ParA family protein [Halorhabdus sp. CBA1104]|uniref:ParA family protein n=1 Tax=unclassified Halorhabdus TaxID=2621901 RepID=UPI0012B3E3DC|nr:MULTISPECIES: ParA family protein [unclassified Halorhabdus]QGN08238.1 ParA family protein [Halorhabdus sp. CBA1104]